LLAPPSSARSHRVTPEEAKALAGIGLPGWLGVAALGKPASIAIGSEGATGSSARVSQRRPLVASSLGASRSIGPEAA